MNNRILFLTPALGKGGAETQMIKVARFLKHQNKDVLIISLKNINDFPAELELEGLNIIFLRNNWLYNFIPNIYLLFKTVKDYKPDVVIAFMFVAIVVGRLLKTFSTFRLISSIRAARIDRKWAGIFKLTSKLDDIVVYNSVASKSIFEKNNLAKKGGVVIRNAISIPDDNSVESPLNKPFKWISIAHFRIDKDYHTLFRAISILQNYSFRVDVIGHLYDLKWPRQMISDLGIQNHVNLLDFKPNSAHYLTNSDALVLSTFSEGMPNAVLEAMAYSKPVVASNIDSISEIFNELKGGLLFKTGDPTDLAEKMLEIMKMEACDRKKLGIAGRQNILDNFGERHVLNQWLELF